MHPVLANVVWGLKRGALFALAFALGIGVAVLAQGWSAFRAYHPSVVEVLVCGLGTWLLGGAAVGLARPLAQSSMGYLIVATIGGVFVAGAIVVMVVGFSYFSLGTTLVAGYVLGRRIWFLDRVFPGSAV
jgi:hypothetical protein